MLKKYLHISPAHFINNLGRSRTLILSLLSFFLGIVVVLIVLLNPITRPKLMPERGPSAAPPAEGRRIKYWRSSMDPNYVSNTPGKDPMGMDLIPVYEGEDETPGVVRIDPALVQNIGVVSQPVERGDLKMEIRTVGVLDYNQKNVYVISTKFEGWIENVYINYIGQVVRKGEPLFEIYSPDLVSTQQEYLSALRYREKMAQSGSAEALNRADQLLASSRSRLRYWDISQKQIEKLERTGEVRRRMTFSSPANGVVIKKEDVALEGKMASPGMELYQIADISSLWLYVDVYQYQLPWVKVGQEANVEINYFPGESFKGKVLFFDPSVNEQTRTVRMNIEVPNRDGRLRPQMFATVNISPVAVKDAVLVPKSAVLHTGERTVVVVDMGEGRFQPRDVKLGIEGTVEYQVLDGLEGGEEVVISAQFLIDSESNLREAVTKMTLDHGGMPMPSGEPESSGPGTEGGQMQMPGM